MSLCVKYHIYRKLTKSEEEAIRGLGQLIKSENLTAEEIEKITEKTGSPIPEGCPVYIEENKCGRPSTEISIGAYSDKEFYVEASPANRRIIRKIEDIVFNGR